MSDKAILEELGARVQYRRLVLNISQLELSVKAGVARKVIQNIESGHSCTVKGLVRILRALGAIDELDLLLPGEASSPLELAKMKGRERKRASGHRMEHKIK
ncbi:MAG: helix-turn-helix transcriptional regulator [Candidatus Omnitrophica bacterium]|nr:helix-turn-helix transcriptional regulator [Candidatus Omnitrophota bacterium]MDE2010543.1 helix-turn-helix transcriptional regulator [Candidatus Omnitrophota bacterium]MDE2213829.1 helix-turn-helix transcriptional regulator [Candidatus Omnitrophota bacterium]MDE2232410.1 helix-turn-helix transcriptional regulator [Candidatus Omnitrophota bacterium]